MDQAKAGKVGAAAQKLDQDVAGTFGLSVPDYAQLKGLSNAAYNELRAVDIQQTQHANQRAKYEVPPDAATLRGFEQKRVEIVNRNIAAIQKQLNASAWGSFQRYINGTHRNMYRVVAAKTR